MFRPPMNPQRPVASPRLEANDVVLAGLEVPRLAAALRDDDRLRRRELRRGQRRELLGGVGAGAAALFTVTATAAVVVLLPAASRATAVRVCCALLAVVVSHVTPYGALVSSAPRLVPSSLNCTPATPTLSLAFAVTLTDCSR